MTAASAIDVVADCYEAECRSLIGHLPNSSPFISWLAVSEQAVVRRIVDDEARHERELVDLMLELDGFPPPAIRGTETGAIAYLDLIALLPRIIADKRRLLAAYEANAPRLAADKRASSLIARILDDERRHLADLQKIEKAH